MGCFEQPLLWPLLFTLDFYGAVNLRVVPHSILTATFQEMTLLSIQTFCMLTLIK
jgi:hypothetical protein